jgi:DNA-directed RNA polymerase subunit RPC12/RpoP
LNPVAWFVTKKQPEAGQNDFEALEEALVQPKEYVASVITQHYKKHRPNSDHDADGMYNFWVKELDCVSCGLTVPLFKHYRNAAGRYEINNKSDVFCPDCGLVTLVHNWQSECVCNDCGHDFELKERNVSRSGKYDVDINDQDNTISVTLSPADSRELRGGQMMPGSLSKLRGSWSDI